MKKLTVFGLILSVLSLFLFSCEGSEDGVAVDGVTLNRTTQTMIAGGNTFLLVPTISPADAANKAVSWSSSDESVATVAAEATGGRVTPLAAGTADITVTTVDGGKTATCVITVNAGSAVTGVTLDKTAWEMLEGRTYQLVATIDPANATRKNIIWSSNNDAAATVSLTGLVRGVAPGTATITATTEDGGFTADCAFTITERGNTEPLGDKDSLSGQAAGAYFDAKGLTLGWNLGNQFDAPSETAWINIPVSQQLLYGVRDAGFSVLRIPITWDNSTHPIGPAPTYTIQEAYLNRIVEVVDMAYNAELVTIINIHHDRGWLSVSSAAASTESYNTITAKFTAIWAQLSEKFKDYGDWLIFEPFNELHDGGWGWNVPPAQTDVINKWNQVFTDTVRAAGGCNTERFLVIQPICARFERVTEPEFELPIDTIANKQIVSVHFYYPESFALNGSSNAWVYDFETNFGGINSTFTSKGIPVIIGECGATYQNRTGEAGEIAEANRLLYMKELGAQSAANGMVPILWDNGTFTSSGTGETFGLINRATGLPNSEREAAVIQAILDGVQGN